MSTASSSSSTGVLTTSVPGSSSAAGPSAVVPTSATVAGTLSVENLRALIREEIGSANGVPSASAASSASPAMAG